MVKTGDFLKEGCLLQGSIGKYGTCRCQHLTEFAIIGDVSVESDANKPGIIITPPSDIDLATVVSFFFILDLV